MQLFECKILYQREVADGKIQKQSDTYLIDAVSFADAETRVLKEVEPFVFAGQDINVKSIRKVNYNEILPDPNGHFWFKAKLKLTTVDENDGKEKKITINILLQAVNIDDANQAINKFMANAIMDYEITNIQVTDIVDVLSLVKNA